MRWVVSMLVAAALFLPSLTHGADEKPTLTFTQDDKDLIVSTAVTANNSPHVLWTHSIDLGKDVYLYYYVFQNRDLLVRGGGGTRSIKQVEVKWRLAGQKQGDKGYHVKEQFLPNSAELNELLPRLKKLAAEGVKKDE